MTLKVIIKVGKSQVEKEISDDQLGPLLPLLGVEWPPPLNKPYRSPPSTGTKRNQPIDTVYSAVRADRRIANLCDDYILWFITQLPIDGAPRSIKTATERLRRVAHGVRLGHSLESATQFGTNGQSLNRIKPAVTHKSE
jgi:hypothetical protein